MISKKGLTAIILTGAIFIGAGVGAGTYAYFTATATSGGNTITAGTLKFGGKNDNSGILTMGLNDVNSLQPGDNETDYHYSPVFTLENKGTLALKLRLNNIVSGDDKSILYYGDDNSCTGLKMKIQRVGSQKLPDKTEANAEPTTIVYTDLCDFQTISEISTNHVILENTLPSGASQQYRVVYYVPKEADNSFQGAGSNEKDKITFTFDATQTNRTDDGWNETITPNPKTVEGEGN